MKLSLFSALFGGLLVFCSVKAYSQTGPLQPYIFIENFCDHEQLEKNAQLEDPLYFQKMEEFERNYRDVVNEFIKNNPDAGQAIGGRVVYTIPVVVHVMHLSGTPVGTGENISMAQIEQGVQDMSDAFRHTGGPAYTNASHHIPAINGVDVEIQFCLAKRTPANAPTTGVNRVATTSSNLLRDVPVATPGATSGDLVLKNLSRWDPTKYINIWLVNEICITAGDCDVAGYAFFSGAHGQPYDGIVNEADQFGSSQDNSKVHIHEAGHYFNLYHTFEGGCPNGTCTTIGDRVCDTPPDNSLSAVSCGAAANSCSTDVPDIDDLYEDYMDYGFQSCQSIYTAGQATRMQTALTTTRVSLTTSNGCTATTSDALVYFYDSGATVTESSAGGTSGCRGYADVNLRIQLYNPAPAGGTTVTIAWTAGTTHTPADFTYVTNPVTIGAGNSFGNIVVRVYDDRAVEGAETAIFSITTVSGGTAASFQQTFTLTINDNDVAPSGDVTTIFSEGFDNNGNNWVMGNFGAATVNKWAIGTDNDCLNGGAGYISNDLGVNNNYTGATATNAFMFREFDAQGINNLQMKFDCIINGNSSDRCRIIGRPTSVGNPSFNTFGSPNLFDKPCPTPFSATFNFPAGYNSFPQVGFYFTTASGAAENPAITIDNLQLNYAASGVASSTTTVTEYFGPLSTVYFKNGTGELIGKIENLSTWDYGCTIFAIDQAGTTAFHPTNFATVWMTSKTLLVTPTTNNPTGQNKVTLYYSGGEVSGWVTGSGQPQSSMRVTKGPTTWASGGGGNTNANSASFATTQAAWGTGTSFTATVTGGFSGFAVSNLGVVLPVELTEFRAKLASDQKSVQLNWRTATEQNNARFTLERAIDGGRTFEPIHEQLGNGTTQSPNEYRFLDKNAQPGTNIYRLSQMDFDGKTTAIGMASVEVPFPVEFEIMPNPASPGGELAIFASLPRAGEIALDCFDMSGRLVFSQKMEAQKGESLIPVPFELASGVYVVRMLHENGQVVKRLIVR